MIDEAEFFQREGTPEIDLQGTAILHPPVHAGLEEAKFAAAIRLGAVQSQVGVLQQDIEVCAVGRRQRNANARADIHHVAINNICPAYQVDNSSRQNLSLFGTASSRPQNGKFITAKPRHHVIFPGHVEQALCDFAQQRIAVLMPQRIIDRLEPI